MATRYARADYGALIQQFCAVTGADELTGEHLLDACDGDVEMAIGMHLDGSGAGSASAAPVGTNTDGSRRSSASAESASSSQSDSVRAPIPQTEEVLVDSHNVIYGRNNRRRKVNTVFDAFRDFQAEARQQMLVVNGDASSSSKRRTLEDLFRPPLELLHKGSFRSACDVGKMANRWLLVNVQNVQEFACQALNRDVWSNSTVKEVVRSRFILWQVYSDSEEGKKYMQFYDVDSWPYIAVLDPRTGEKMCVWHQVDAMTFCEIVSEFLSCHPAPDEELADSPPGKKSRMKTGSILDASEDSQLKAALAASLRSKTKHKNDDDEEVDLTDSSDTDDLETFSDSDSQQSTSTGKVATAAAVKTNLTVAKSHAVKTVQSCSMVRTTSLPDDRVDTAPAVTSVRAEKGSTVMPGRAATGTAVDNNHAVKSPPTSPRHINGSGKNCSVRLERLSDAGNDEKNERRKSTSDNSSSNNGSSSAEDSVWKCHLGPASDPPSNIVFRFPDGIRRTLSLPCSSSLQALAGFASEQGFPAERFELVTTFPRRNLSLLEQTASLLECKLFPQDTIFVQERS